MNPRQLTTFTLVTVWDFLHVQRPLVGLVLQNQLLQQVKGPLVLSSLPALHHHQPLLLCRHLQTWESITNSKVISQSADELPAAQFFFIGTHLVTVRTLKVLQDDLHDNILLQEDAGVDFFLHGDLHLYHSFTSNNLIVAALP